MNNLLTGEEVRHFLEIGEPELEDFLRRKKLNAYKIGGAYVRFRKEDVLNLRSELALKKPKTPPRRFSLLARLGDFWRFNNFYILSTLVILGLIWVALKT